MELLAQHLVLAEGESEEACKLHVLKFFEKTSLVCYDNVVIEDRILSGTDPEFESELAQGLKKNRNTLRKFINELGSTGFEQRGDLMQVDQGYHSKILHIIAHFLDGFIGIDSVFYNLVEDSHWLSSDIEIRIKEVPARFKLLSLKCYSMTPREAALLHM